MISARPPKSAIAAGLVVCLMCLGDRGAHADCASEAKAALAARLAALPLREVVESDRDGDHTRIVQEFETLRRFHTVIAGAADSVLPNIELLILDGKGWSKDRGSWQPFPATVATADSTLEDENTLADQLTGGARVECLGSVEKGGRTQIGYELHLDGDPSSGDPYTTMQLYVDPVTRLPSSFDLTGQGDTGPATTHETFEYDKSIRFVPPA